MSRRAVVISLAVSMLAVAIYFSVRTPPRSASNAPPRDTSPSEESVGEPAVTTRPTMTEQPPALVASAAPVPDREGGLVIAGRVVDETGTPIAGAKVGSSANSSAIVTTDDQGRYELVGLDVGPVNVFATAAGYAPKQVRGLRAGSRNSDLRLERPARARGRVEQRGSPRPLTVSACQYDSYFSKEVCIARRLYDPPEGEFVLEDLPSGTFDVVFEAEGHLTERVRVVLEAGKEAVLRPVVLNVGAQNN